MSLATYVDQAINTFTNSCHSSMALVANSLAAIPICWR